MKCNAYIIHEWRDQSCHFVSWLLIPVQAIDPGIYNEAIDPFIFFKCAQVSSL